MRNVVHSIFLSIIIFLFFEDVLTFSFHRRPSTHSNSQTARRVNWSDDSSVIRDNLPRITHDLVHQLDTTVGSLVSSLTIDTVSNYMLEFRNDVLQRWMVEFQNYSTVGFPENDWTKYIEKMIIVGDHKVQVIVKSPKKKPKPGVPAMAPGTAIQYDFDIEPRKIANQILTVRENVCEEIVNDLNSVQYENEEAVRFVTVWISDGREVAEKSRKLTRMAGQSESTPQRDRNYRDVSTFVTELAIMLVKKNYAESLRDPATVEYLDVLLGKLKKEREAQSPADQFFNQNYGPRTLLEELFHAAMIGSITGSSVNVMKLSKMIADTRWNIAVQVQNILRTQTANSRKYYKMIKDHGGVLSQRPKKEWRADFQIIDLKEERKRKLAEAQQMREQKEFSTATSSSSENEAGSSELPDFLFGTDLSSKKIISTTTRETVSTSSNANRDPELLPVEPLPDSSSTEDNGADDVNLLDMDFGMAGPMSM